MKRYLFVKGGVVINVVGYEDDVIPAPVIDGYDVILDPTGITNLGDAFDQRDIQLDRADQIILKELFRISNALRVINLQQAFTATQYRAFLKTLI